MTLNLFDQANRYDLFSHATRAPAQVEAQICDLHAVLTGHNAKRGGIGYVSDATRAAERDELARYRNHPTRTWTRYVRNCIAFRHDTTRGPASWRLWHAIY